VKFVLEIDCNNQAFKEDAFYEVCRIIHQEAQKMGRWVGNDPHGWKSTLVDSNGNKVGVTQFVGAKKAETAAQSIAHSS